MQSHSIPKILDCLGQPFAQIHLWLPVEHGARPADIRLACLRVALDAAIGLHDNTGGISGYLINQIGKLADGDLAWVPKIDRFIEVPSP